jgi:plasmid stabilization system protein ParE
MNVIWAGPARADLDAIWTFIAQDNIDAADTTILTIQSAEHRLRKFPKLG